MPWENMQDSFQVKELAQELGVDEMSVIKRKSKFLNSITSYQFKMLIFNISYLAQHSSLLYGIIRYE